MRKSSGDSSVITVGELDLALTLNSGQAFHWTALEDGWTGCIGNQAAFLRQQGHRLEFHGVDEELLRHYLALDHDLASFRSSCYHPIVTEAAAACRGLRILRQPRWECLATFILSPMKQVSHIRGMSLALRKRFGTPLEGTPVPSFPTAKAIANATEADLRACGLGFRAKGLLGTAQCIASGEFDPEQLVKLSTEEAREALCTLPGIGRKVANCILLFAYERLEVVPVDVWIGRILGSFQGRRKATPAELERYGERVLGPYAGYIQQWLFHQARTGHLSLPQKKRPEGKKSSIASSTARTRPPSRRRIQSA
jgi:N-glycosylase/DNA lyase